MRVLHVINRIAPSGGAEVSLSQLLPRLADLGVQQGLVTLLPTTAPHVVDRLERAGVQMFDAGGAGPRASVTGVRAAVRAFRPHLISSSLYEANRASRVAGALTGTPVLCGLVNTPYDAQARAEAPTPWKLALVARLEAVLARRMTTAFHALTEATARSAVQHLGIERSAVTVVPRGRDRQALGEPSVQRRARVRAALDLGDEDLVVLNVGRQERQKGQRLLVEAFEPLAARDARAVLLVAGRPGAATDELRQRLSRSPASSKVRLLGMRDDVADLLSAADVFAFSSLWEGLGGAVLEAMAMSVPVVSFDVPAVAEVLGGCGRLAPVGDAAALGRELLAVSGDRDLRQELADRARRRFDEHFDLEVVVPAMEQLYRAVAALPPPGRRRSPSPS